MIIVKLFNNLNNFLLKKIYFEEYIVFLKKWIFYRLRFRNSFSYLEKSIASYFKKEKYYSLSIIKLRKNTNFFYRASSTNRYRLPYNSSSSSCPSKRTCIINTKSKLFYLTFKIIENIGEYLKVKCHLSIGGKSGKIKIFYILSVKEESTILKNEGIQIIIGTPGRVL